MDLGGRIKGNASIGLIRGEDFGWESGRKGGGGGGKNPPPKAIEIGAGSRTNFDTKPSPPQQQRNGGKNTRTCYVCGSPNHLKRDCPNNKDPKTSYIATTQIDRNL